MDLFAVLKKIIYEPTRSRFHESICPGFISREILSDSAVFRFLSQRRFSWPECRILIKTCLCFNTVRASQIEEPAYLSDQMCLLMGFIHFLIQWKNTPRFHVFYFSVCFCSAKLILRRQTLRETSRSSASTDEFPMPWF